MDITIKDVIRTIKRFIFLIVALTFIGGVVAGLYSLVGGNSYHIAEAKFACKNVASVEDVKEQALNDAIITKAISALEENYPEITSAQLKRMISVKQVGTTKYATLSVSHAERLTAYYVCDVVSNIVASDLTAYVSQKTAGPSLQTAYVSNNTRNIAIGIIFGFILSMVVAFVFAVATKVVYSRSDIEKHFDVKVIGAIPKKNKEEALKLLSLNAKDLIFNNGLKKVAVVGVGKTCKEKTFIVKALEMFGFGCSYQGASGKDLAWALAESGKRVVYVDALNLGGDQYGLNDYLKDDQEKNPVLVTGNKNLFVIKGGSKVDNSVELLSSDRMKTLLNSLEKQSDCVILDLPSMGFSADAVAVNNVVDCYVLGVKAKINGVQQVNDALGELKQIDANVAGIVLENTTNKEVFGGRLLEKQ